MTVARSAGAGALPPRSPGRIRAESSQHLHHLRNRQAWRAVVHRHGVSRRRDPEASSSPAEPLDIETVLSLGHRDCRRPRRRARRRASSIATSSPPTFSSPSADTPRFSTSVWPRWRPRRAPPARLASTNSATATIDRTASHQPRHHARHRRLHVARAGARQGTRRAHRSVLLRRRALRDGHGPAALPRRKLRQ